MRFRWYDPWLGRFLTRDPLGVWGDLLNLGNGTAYVGNNPWSYTDPWGLFTDEVHCNAIKDHEKRNPPPQFYAGTVPEPFDASVGGVPPIPRDADLSLRPDTPGLGVLTTGGELVGRMIIVPLDWGLTAQEMGADFGEGRYVSGALGTLGFLPFLPGSAAKKGIGDPAQAAADRAVARLRTAPDAQNANRITDPSRMLPSPSRANPQHHVFPQRQDLADRFREAGIDVHEHTMRIPESLHRQIHSGSPGGGAWNQAWYDFLKANPDATPQDIYKQAGKLIYDFQLPGCPVGPYRR